MRLADNPYITYLNSLHSLTAGGSNALAESQTLSEYFGEIYEPFPITNGIVDLLKDDTERVVILTGHAGDGKSTLAVDILKRLRGTPDREHLTESLKEKEVAFDPPVTVVKDMSEASASRRAEYLEEAFGGAGSWLIVSNTGPLLQSLREYSEQQCLERDIESELLKQLMAPVDHQNLVEHKVDGFSKELLIINLTRLDNVEIGSKVLTRLVSHSGWAGCEGCDAQSVCPLLANRNAVLEAVPTVEERVRWVYQRLNAYEQRLTLRQIVAQLAFALTGGKTCSEIHSADAQAHTPDPTEGGLQDILFSEGFFGYRQGLVWPELERLQAVSLLRRTDFGGPVAVNFERILSTTPGLGWATLPSILDPVWRRWSKKSVDASGVRWRFAIRRMTYMFGTVIPNHEQTANLYLQSILRSPSLTDFDEWKKAGRLTLSKAKKNRLRVACLRVLLEVYSGFSSGQFSKTDTLYLTLLRPDQAVVQPTQLVIESFQFKDFDLEFDYALNLPALSYQGTGPRLILTLPLLDYIFRRDSGELGGVLTPLHQGQLDGFRSELLKLKPRRSGAEQTIEILRASIEGEVSLHTLQLDLEDCTLEVS